MQDPRTRLENWCETKLIILVSASIRKPCFWLTNLSPRFLLKLASHCHLTELHFFLTTRFETASPPSEANLELTWGFLKPSGTIWSHPEQSGAISRHPRLPETIWSNLELSRQIWANLFQSRQICFNECKSRQTRDHLSQSEPIWAIRVNES